MVLLVTVGVTLYRQRTELRTAMREDLIAFMFEEESLRFLGHQDQAAEMMMPTAQPGWQRAYLRTFETTGLRPPKTQPTGIDFDGQCALVNVNLVLGAVTCSGKLSLVVEHAEQAVDTETMRSVKDKAMEFLRES